MSIHPTAIIDPKAELAEGVEVQPYAIIGAQCVIGAGTIIGPHCVIDGRAVIGENNRFFSGAQVGVLSQDLKHNHDFIGRTVIGDNNVFREHVTISASTITGYDDEHRVTSIGNHCMLMAYAHIAHDCHVGDYVIMANCASLSGHVDVESKAILGGLSGIHQECVIGTLAFVGGMTRVNKDVAPYMLVEGNPAACHGPNSVGLRRNNLSPEARSRIKAMYKLMFRSNLNTTQALHEIEATVAEGDERNRFVDFFRRSLRGVTK